MVKQVVASQNVSGALPWKTAAENAAFIQDELLNENNGGTVELDVPGTYLCNELYAPNFTTLKLNAGVILKRANNRNCPLIKNKDAGYIIQGQLFTRTNNIVTCISDTGHTFQIGQKLYLPPSRFTDTSAGGVVIISAVTASTWSYPSAGSNGAMAVSTQFISVIPITRSIANSNLSTVVVGGVNYIKVVDSIGDIPVGAQIYVTSDNAADTAFIGMVDATIVIASTGAGWLFKTPNNTAGIPVGNLQLNYCLGVKIDGEGRIEGNWVNNSGGTFIGTAPIFLGNPSFSRIGGGIKISGSFGRGIALANPSNCVIDAQVDDARVGLQVEGGYKKLTVTRLSGASQLNEAWDGGAATQRSDDFMALTATKYAGDGTGGAQNYDNATSAYGLTGNFDCAIGELHAYNAINGLKITGDASGGAFDRITCRKINMYGLDPNLAITGAAVAINDDGPRLQGTAFNYINIEAITFDTSYASGTSQRNLNWNGGGNSGTLIMKGFKQDADFAQGIILNGRTLSATATTDGVTVTVTAAAGHNYVAGQRVLLTGVTSDTTFNGPWIIAGPITATTFTFAYTRAGPVTGTLLATGGIIRSATFEASEGIPSTTGNRTIFSGSTGGVDQLIIDKFMFNQGSGTGTTQISTGPSFWCPSIKLSNITTFSNSNNTGVYCVFTGKHKEIILENCQPLQADALNFNTAGAAAKTWIRFNNTTNIGTIDVYILNSHLRYGSGCFEDNANIGASILRFHWHNSKATASQATNAETYRFFGAGTPVIHHIGTEDNDFSAVNPFWSGTTATYRVNCPTAPINLNANAAKIATASQVDGDTAMSTTAVNGLPTANRLVRWSALLSKWVSVMPVLTGSTPMVLGTFTVTTTLMQATSEVRIRNRVAGGVPGAILPVTYTAGTNFVVTSTSGTDTSTLVWDLYGTN